MKKLLSLIRSHFGEGNGTPLQYSCLENPRDGGAWWAAVHGVAKSRTWLSDFTFTFHFHALGNLEYTITDKEESYNPLTKSATKKYLEIISELNADIYKKVPWVVVRDCEKENFCFEFPRESLSHKNEL